MIKSVPRENRPKMSGVYAKYRTEIRRLGSLDDFYYGNQETQLDLALDIINNVRDAISDIWAEDEQSGRITLIIKV